MFVLDCTGAIGVGKGEIPDDAITASSSYDDLSQGARGRLNIEYQPPRKSGWCAGVNNQNQYLQIDLGKNIKQCYRTIHSREKAVYFKAIIHYMVTV